MNLLLPLLYKYSPYIIGAIVLILVASQVYQAGYNSAQNKYKAIIVKQEAAYWQAQEEAIKEAQKQELLMGQAVIDQALINALKSQKREIQVVEVTKWRTKYEKNPDAGKCVVPNEFVRVLDNTGQESSSMPEETSSGAVANDSPGSISDIELLQYTTDTKMMCLRWRDKLIAWQEREKALEAIK